MINEEQLKNLSKKYKINEYIVAREFIQISFLKELYNDNFSENIYFKGGTAIRLLYGGNRFSEDLDFTITSKEKKFTSNINKFFSKLENQYPFKFKPKDSLTGKSFLLTAILPYLKGDVFIKLDFSMREEILDPNKVILETDYPIILHSFIQCLSLNEIFAEKIRALLKRKKPRDLYDLWILQELGAEPDIQLINKKLSYYNESLDKKMLIKELDKFTQDEFIKDLRPFVAVDKRDKLDQLYEYVITYLNKKFNKLLRKS